MDCAVFRENFLIAILQVIPAVNGFFEGATFPAAQQTLGEECPGLVQGSGTVGGFAHPSKLERFRPPGHRTKEGCKNGRILARFLPCGYIMLIHNTFHPIPF